MRLEKRLPSFKPKIYAKNDFIGNILFSKNNITTKPLNVRHLNNPETTCILVFKYYLL